MRFEQTKAICHEATAAKVKIPDSQTCEFSKFVYLTSEFIVGTSHDSLVENPLHSGYLYKQFRDKIDLKQRRSIGAFFSGAKLSDTIASSLANILDPSSIVCDPTSGMGDLLIAYANYLPIKKSLAATLASWGEILHGVEIRKDLVKLTKIRLADFARHKGGFSEPVPVDLDLFPNVVDGDFFDVVGRLGHVDGFLFNPPFFQHTYPNSRLWPKGKVNSAAVFLEVLLSQKKKAAPVSAILPEVLKCGSRYEPLRNRLFEEDYTPTYSPFGRFDQWTDVDVFTTLITQGGNSTTWIATEAYEYEKIGELFHVSVGAVVPHRHKNVGPWCRYICAKTTPRWERSFEPKLNKRFNGTKVKPPFVVVRRTSSPSDRFRASATVISGDRDVAVENHLIVLKPKDAKLETCQKLLMRLGAEDINHILNRSMRCRHLTVKSIQNLPWRCQ